jgi:hypothetical protein
MVMTFGLIVLISPALLRRRRRDDNSGAALQIIFLFDPAGIAANRPSRTDGHAVIVARKSRRNGGAV